MERDDASPHSLRRVIFCDCRGMRLALRSAGPRALLASEGLAVRELNHILCPLDLSSVSSALAHAFAWAHWYGAELHVLHVAPIPVAVPGMPGVVVTLDQGSLVHTHLEVQHFAKEVCLRGGRTTSRLHGDPAAVIVGEPQRYRNALVVVGYTHATVSSG